MRPTHNWLSGHRWAKALRAGGLLILALHSSLGFAQADTIGFTGDFAPTNWTPMPDAGSISFTNSNTELVLSGPYKPSEPTFSTDPILYNGPLSGGLVVGGTVEFNWQYYSPGYSSDDGWAFVWTPAGGTSNRVDLADGPGAFNSTYSIQLSPGATFEFELLTDTPMDKPAASLTVTNFQFHANVPEPSTEALFASVLIFLGGVHWWRSRKRASIQR